MRALAIGLGIAAILAAAVLSLRDNTARVSTITRIVTPSPVPVRPAPSAAPSPTAVRQAELTAPALPAVESPFQNILVHEPHTLAVYDATSARLRFRLPGGQVSADGNFYVSTVVLGQETKIYRYDLETGERLPPGVLSGRWDLGAISAQGRWVTLTRVPEQFQGTYDPALWRTAVAVYDMVDYGLAQSIDLEGQFDPYAISFDGGSLFLVEHLPGANYDRYQLRFYDLFAGRLQGAPLVDERDPGQVMDGDPWESLASPDGQWLLTLYLRPEDKSAYIQALDLKNKQAMRIDLTPGVRNLDLLRHYTLALAPGGQTLYAMNPALGTLAVVDLHQFEISRLVAFQARQPSGGKMPVDRPPPEATVSQMGNGVFWSDGPAVWSYDVRSGSVQSLGEMPAVVLGLHVSFDGRQLLVVDEDDQVHILDSHIPGPSANRP